MFPAEVPLGEDVDFNSSPSSFRFTGGDIRNVALEAAFLAAQDGKVVTMRQLGRALARQMMKQGRDPFRDGFQTVPCLDRRRCLKGAQVETPVASIRAETKARGVRVQRPPAPPSVPATSVETCIHSTNRRKPRHSKICSIRDSASWTMSSISPAMPAVAEGVSKEGAIEQEQPKEPVTLAETPATPEEDPAYQVVVKQLGVKAKKERTPTKTAKQKQDETVLAANLPVEVTSKEKAYGEDLDKLDRGTSVHRGRIHGGIPTDHREAR